MTPGMMYDTEPGVMQARLDTAAHIEALSDKQLAEWIATLDRTGRAQLIDPAAERRRHWRPVDATFHHLGITHLGPTLIVAAREWARAAIRMARAADEERTA